MYRSCQMAIGSCDILSRLGGQVPLTDRMWAWPDCPHLDPPLRCSCYNHDATTRPPCDHATSARLPVETGACERSVSGRLCRSAPLPLRGLPLHAPLLLKRFLECPLTAPFPLTRFSARSAPFSAPRSNSV